MAFADQALLAANVGFRDKVRVAAVYAALAVMGETPFNKAQVDEKRQALSMAILADGCAGKLDAFAWAVASFGTITGASVDSDIQFVVNSIFSDLAGLTGVEVASIA